jgi:WD40 repeat protein
MTPFEGLLLGHDGPLCSAFPQLYQISSLLATQLYGAVQALKISPDGRILASSGDDGAIQLWDLESGELRETLRRDRPYERMNITGIKGLTEVQKSTLHALGATDEGTVWSERGHAIIPSEIYSKL